MYGKYAYILCLHSIFINKEVKLQTSQIGIQPGRFSQKYKTKINHWTRKQHFL